MINITIKLYDFSVQYNSEINMICTTSDDRSARLWKVKFISGQPDDWSTADIELAHSLYGHSARVFRNDVNI